MGRICATVPSPEMIEMLVDFEDFELKGCDVYVTVRVLTEFRPKGRLHRRVRADGAQKRLYKNYVVWVVSPMEIHTDKLLSCTCIS